MAKVPRLVVCIACITAILFLLSSMCLLSSIIVWLSVDFTGPLPYILGFLVGVLSLFVSFIGILMIGVSHMRKILGYFFLLMSIVTLIASAAVLVPFILSFTTFCTECEQAEQTVECVQACDDECCFTYLSFPLAVTFIAVAGVAVLSSLLGITVSLPYIWFAHTGHTSKKH